MNTIDEQIAVLQAYKEGKVIEYRCHDDYNGWSDWASVRGYGGSPYNFNFSNEEYRIAEVPAYRPYKDLTELYEAIKRHGLLVQYTSRTDLYMVITLASDCSVTLCGTDLVGFEGLQKSYVWADDGTPCGVKID